MSGLQDAHPVWDPDASAIPLSLRRLRAVEFVLFGVLVADLVVRSSPLIGGRYFIDRVDVIRAAGNELEAHEMLIGYLWRLTGQTTLFLVTYGVIIPDFSPCSVACDGD